MASLLTRIGCVRSFGLVQYKLQRLASLKQLISMRTPKATVFSDRDRLLEHLMNDYFSSRRDPVQSLKKYSNTGSVTRMLMNWYCTSQIFPVGTQLKDNNDNNKRTTIQLHPLQQIRWCRLWYGFKPSSLIGIR